MDFINKDIFESMNNLVKNDWYEHLVEECQAILVESGFNSRWALVEGYWLLGKRISEEHHNFEREQIYGDKIVQRVATSLQKSGRTIHQSIQFYKKFPDINTLPDGKSITWHKICNDILPAPKSEPLSGSLDLPTGKYSTIVIDPPWPINFIPRDERPNQIDTPYPLMSLEDIQKLPIQELANNDSHLYLWVTHKFLPDSFEIVKGWGFEYQCLMTWVKNVGFTPYSWMYTTEHVLFCRRGNLPLLKLGKRLDFTGKVREHSRKPDEFYDLIKQVSPEPRIDLFSREKREGYAQWGNEKEKFE